MVTLEKLLFGMALFVLIAAGLWVAIPVVVLAWVLGLGSEKVLNDVVETSAPGSGFALVSIVITWALVVGVVFLAAVAVLPYVGGG